MSETIDLGYRPRRQFIPFHARPHRWAGIVAHRRAGKTVAAVMDLIDDACRCTRPDGRFSYMAPTYGQAKDIAWGYLKRFTDPIPGVIQRESDLMVVLPNDTRVRLYGSDNFQRLRGGYSDAAVLDEFGDFDPRAWPEVIRPSLADRKGRATFIGTSRGHNHFYNIIQPALNDSDWYASMLRASETGILPPEELADLLKTLGPDLYAQEMECSFEAAIRGAIYRKEIDAARAEGRICSVPYDPSVPCWVSWDLGILDPTVLWVAQVVGREIHLIDYYEASGENITHFFAWLDSKPYRYVADILPHDAKAREKGTGKTIEELANANGRKVRIAPDLSIEDGINALRLLFPRMWIDATKCARGLECLSHYRNDWNDKMQVFKPAPVHDWASHGSDSARYLAVGMREQLRPAMRGADPSPRSRYIPARAGAWMAA